MDLQSNETEFEFVLGNFSDLGEVAYSKSVTVENNLWRLMILKKDAISNSQGSKGNYLGVFLQCVTETHQTQDWSASVRATIKLVNHKNPEKSYSKDFNHRFSTKSTDWGFSSFMKQKDVSDPSKGFLKDNSLEFHAKLAILSEKKESCLEKSSGLCCPECNDAFVTQGNKQPMSLKCGHTFCLECLQSNSSSKSDGKLYLCCSLCRQEHLGSSESNLWFPNYSMIQIIGNVVPKSKHFCSVHQHDKDYFCFNDQMLVCIYCAYHGEHMHHDCKHVDDAKRQVETSLQEVKRKVTSRSAELERQVQLLSDERKLLKSQETRVTQVVDDFYSQIEEVLHRQKELLLNELSMHTTELTSAVDVQMSSLKEHCSEAKQGLMKYGMWQLLPTQEALGSVAALKSQLLSFAAKSDSLPLVPSSASSSSKISVELPSSDILASLGNLGKLKFESERTVTQSQLGYVNESQSESELNLFNVEDPPPTKKRRGTPSS